VNRPAVISGQSQPNGPYQTGAGKGSQIIGTGQGNLPTGSFGNNKQTPNPTTSSYNKPFINSQEQLLNTPQGIRPPFSQTGSKLNAKPGIGGNGAYGSGEIGGSGENGRPSYGGEIKGSGEDEDLGTGNNAKFPGTQFGSGGSGETKNKRPGQNNGQYTPVTNRPTQSPSRGSGSYNSPSLGSKTSTRTPTTKSPYLTSQAQRRPFPTTTPIAPVQEVTETTDPNLQEVEGSSIGIYPSSRPSGLNKVGNQGQTGNYQGGPGNPENQDGQHRPTQNVGNSRGPTNNGQGPRVSNTQTNRGTTSTSGTRRPSSLGNSSVLKKHMTRF